MPTRRQRLLQRLGALRLGRPVAAVGDPGGEAVRLAAGLQLLLGRGRVALGLGGRVVEVELLVAGHGRRHDRAADIAAGHRAAVGVLQRDVVGRVLDRLPAGHVGERRHLRVDVEEPAEPGERVVRLGLEGGVGQDLGPRRRLHAGAREVDLGVTGQQPVVDVVGVHVHVDDDLAGQLRDVRDHRRRSTAGSGPGPPSCSAGSSGTRTGRWTRCASGSWRRCPCPAAPGPSAGSSAR